MIATTSFWTVALMLCATAQDGSPFIPPSSYPAVPGKQIMVLVGDVAGIQAVGGRVGPADMRCLSFGGSSYYGFNLPDAAGSFATGPGLKALGIETSTAIVEVEVENGKGSPEGKDQFRATRLRVLDGTKDFPIKTADVIADLRKKYDARLKEQEKAIDEAMERTGKAAAGARKPTGPRETRTLMYVTWLPETEKVEVRFWTQVTDGAYAYGFGAVPADGPPKGGGMRYGTQWGIRLGWTDRVSKAGAIEKGTPLELTSFTRELPPPLSAGGPR